jgi:hypothetical protein
MGEIASIDGLIKGILDSKKNRDYITYSTDNGFNLIFGDKTLIYRLGFPVLVKTEHELYTLPENKACAVLKAINFEDDYEEASPIDERICGEIEQMVDNWIEEGQLMEIEEDDIDIDPDSEPESEEENSFLHEDTEEIEIVAQEDNLLNLNEDDEGDKDQVLKEEFIILNIDEFENNIQFGKGQLSTEQTEALEPLNIEEFYEGKNQETEESAGIHAY